MLLPGESRLPPTHPAPQTQSASGKSGWPPPPLSLLPEKCRPLPAPEAPATPAVVLLAGDPRVDVQSLPAPRTVAGQRPSEDMRAAAALLRVTAGRHPGFRGPTAVQGGACARAPAPAAAFPLPQPGGPRPVLWVTYVHRATGWDSLRPLGASSPIPAGCVDLGAGLRHPPRRAMVSPESPFFCVHDQKSLSSRWEDSVSPPRGTLRLSSEVT